MFSKYAAEILDDIYIDCLIKSISSKDEDESRIYKSISDKANSIREKLLVEKEASIANKPHG